MSTLTDAAGIIRTAESSLRELMQKALNAGDYRELPTLARMAEQLAGMTTRIGTAEEPPESLQAKPTPARKPAASPKGKPVNKKQYPRFKREGDRLVKIGWSKSEKSEYQHRSPSNVARLLLAAVSELSKRKPVFAVEDLLPLTDPSDKSEVAPHLVYLSLAWLKAEGIVLPKGREGYSLLVTEEPAKLFEERWKALPTR